MGPQWIWTVEVEAHCEDLIFFVELIPLKLAASPLATFALSSPDHWTTINGTPASDNGSRRQSTIDVGSHSFIYNFIRQDNTLVKDKRIHWQKLNIV
jgi:hypothetical protein